MVPARSGADDYAWDRLHSGSHPRCGAWRFEPLPVSPALMSFVGLVPSEHSSGAKQRRGSITKAGNRYVRRILVEAPWNYRFPARLGETLQPRQIGQPKEIVDTAWKAQVRLRHRFRKLKARGVHHNKVCAAIARELIGFVWDIARKVKPVM